MPVLPQRTEPNDTIFEFLPKNVHDVFAQSVAARGLPNDSVWFQFKQSKASYNLWSRKKSEEEIKARGQWRTVTAMRRHAEPGRVQRLVETLWPHVTTYCRESVNRLKK